MLNFLKLNKKENKETNTNLEFISEKIIIDPIDYYYSNVITRASKTMSNCRNKKNEIKRTGTEG